MLQYRCDDQGGPQPPKPWTEGDDPKDKPKPQPEPDKPEKK